MKYTKIPETTFKDIQLNAGVLLSSFSPSTAEFQYSNMLGATTGGVNFTSNPTYSDFGEDIDNCPKNMKELKKLDTMDIKLSGTFVTMSPALAKRLMGAADIDSTDSTKIVPRKDLVSDDFTDLWWVGDYSDKNDETDGGYIAIHMLNTLSTGGFQLQTGDKTKGNFSFEFTAHYSMAAQDTVPFEVYIKAGGASGDDEDENTGA